MFGKRIIYGLMFLSILGVSCKDRRAELSSEIQNDIITLRVNKPKETLVSEIFDSLSYVVLDDTHKESLIGRVAKLECVDSLFFIKDDKRKLIHKYDDKGNYWCGSVWAPTNYMILKGLSENGYHELAYEIANNCVLNVVKVFEETGTLWENYAPESSQKGSIAKKDFVGWSGLFPISILIEYVFGIKINAEKNEIVWHINLTDEFSVKKLPFGVLGKVDLTCMSRKNIDEKPEIYVNSDIDFTLNILWNGKSKTIYVKASDDRIEVKNNE